LGLAGKYWKGNGSDAALPFDFSVKRYRDTFLQQARNDGSPSGLFRASMTAVFTAWRNYHHRDHDSLARKAFISGFVPRLIMSEKSVANLMETCPDVKILTVIRDPFSWFASAKTHASSYRNIADAMALWSASAHTSIDLATRRPDICRQLNFRDLVRDSQATMQSVCDFAGLSWDDALLTPTFNGLAIRSDSKFRRINGAIDAGTTERWRKYLAQNEINFIEQFMREKTTPPVLQWYLSATQSGRL
jgi:hypothetical protein